MLLFVLREEHQVVVAVSIAYGSRSGLFQFRASSPFVVGVAEGMEREVCLVLVAGLEDVAQSSVGVVHVVRVVVRVARHTSYQHGFPVHVLEVVHAVPVLVGGFRDAEGACRIVALFTISIFINKSNP